MIKKYGKMSEWDTSNVTSMHWLFRNLHKFPIKKLTDTGSEISLVRIKYYYGDYYKVNMPMNDTSSFDEDISKWDVSNVTNMGGMFQGATSFNGDLSKWDTSNVKIMSTMFQHATSFNGDINTKVVTREDNTSYTAWDVSKVTSMTQMFKEATSFSRDISKWDVSNVKNMSAMFWKAELFNGDINTKDVKLSTNYTAWDTSNVINMQGMFTKAKSFNQPLNKWDTSNVKDMGFMFTFAKSFNKNINTKLIPRKDNSGYYAWNVSNVKNMNRMFHGTLSTFRNGETKCLPEYYCYRKKNGKPNCKYEPTSDNTGYTWCYIQSKSLGFCTKETKKTNTGDRGYSGYGQWIKVPDNSICKDNSEPLLNWNINILEKEKKFFKKITIYYKESKSKGKDKDKLIYFVDKLKYIPLIKINITN